MVDSITLDRIQSLHPKIRQEVQDIYVNQICPALTSTVFCRFAYTMRTFAEQDELYALGRTKLFDSAGNRLGQVTKARAGQSFHNYGLAFDIVLIDGKKASWDTAKDFDGDGTSDWMEVINIFKNNEYFWGGDFKGFKDRPHLEKTFGLTWNECLAKHDSNKVDSEGYILL